MRAVLGLSLLFGASWTVGDHLFRDRWGDLAPYERAAIKTLAGLGLITLALSCLALAGALRYATPLLLLLWATGIARTAFFWTPRTPSVDAAPTRWDAVTIAIVVTAGLACLGALAPVTDDDALAYVVPIARHIAHAEAVRVWPDQARSMWPQSQQVLLAYLLRLGSDHLGALTAVEWLLALGVMSGLARRVCTRAEHIAPALVLAFGAPVVAFQVASAKEDLLVVAAAAGTALCLAKADDVVDFAAAGLFAGIAAGAKYPGASIPVAAAIWPLVSKGSHKFRHALVVASCAFVTGGLWYVLNVWRYTNPVAPFFAGAAGTPLDAETLRGFVDAYGAGRGFVAFLLAPLRIFLNPGLFCGRANLYNPLAYVGLAGLLIPQVRRRNAPLFFSAAIIYVVWFFTLQNARLLLPAIVLLAPAAADVVMPVVEKRKLFLTGAWMAAAVSLGVVIAVGVVRATRYVEDPSGFLARETQNYQDLAWMNTHLDPARARVAADRKALDNLDIPWIYLDPTYQIAIAPAELGDPQRFLAACRREGITHLFGNAASFPTIRDSLRLVYQNPASRLGGVRFFREPPTEATAVFEIVSGAQANAHTP